ncbi:MAG: hypothetical protein SFX18_05905 [Pirellulales bacterium]|nr:hypothetical protein [Pirellulales bacterium]
MLRPLIFCGLFALALIPGFSRGADSAGTEKPSVDQLKQLAPSNVEELKVISEKPPLIQFKQRGNKGFAWKLELSRYVNKHGDFLEMSFPCEPLPENANSAKLLKLLQTNEIMAGSPVYSVDKNNLVWLRLQIPASTATPEVVARKFAELVYHAEDHLAEWDFEELFVENNHTVAKVETE